MTSLTMAAAHHADDPARRVIRRVLIANRGEIAVRVARACADAGIVSIAVYSDTDRDALHVKLADEAFALSGITPTQTYLDMNALLDVAQRAGADAIHPGYGFLSENAQFAQRVIDAGLAWIGAPPAAIEALGDKVSARHIAQRAGAPLVAGTPDPVANVSEVLDFVDKHGLPVAIKAAFGGGGRGLKVARTREEVSEQYDSAVREATAAFGRGECFVEKYLDAPRHVETQCLADAHGNVAVVSTRDCSLQRRHQKLIEEAPAPFLTDGQQEQLIQASQAIMREAHYVGAGTCEFLVGKDGTISFLEVNTRLQVEHPVSEEVTGLDLVREQFRIAQGDPLGYDRVETRGHSIEFRINGEDPAAQFLPTPGQVTTFRTPAGPGVRVDSGVSEGDTISGNFDSMLAKLIVTGANRTQALQRAARALREFEIDGLPTVLPFHRAVVANSAFAPADPDEPFSIHTRWIETEGEEMLSALSPASLPTAPPQTEEHAAERVVVEVGGKRFEVVLPGGLGLATAAKSRTGGAPKRKARTRTVSSSVTGDTLTSPMQGTIVKIAVDNGQRVSEGDLIVVLEAMKMEQPLVAHKSGTIGGIDLDIGESITAGATICDIIE